MEFFSIKKRRTSSKTFGNMFPTQDSGQSSRYRICTRALPGPPHWFVGAGGLLDWALAVELGGEGRGGTDVQGYSLGTMEVLEVLEVLECGILGGAGRQEVQRLPPALGVALTVGPQRGHTPGLQLLLQEHHGHLQDVSLLQLGVGVLLVELLLQQSLELLYADIDAISAHFLHGWFP